MYPNLIIIPGLIDTHAHLIQAVYSVYDVQIDSVKDISESIELIRERALVTPGGERGSRRVLHGTK